MRQTLFFTTQWFASFFLLLVLFACKTPKLSDAEEKYRVGEYYKAAEIYRAVYGKTKPDDRVLRGDIAYKMGECNQALNNSARAMTAYLNALRYGCSDSALYLRLGQVMQKEGKYTDAIDYYRKYLTYVPNDPLAINGIIGSEIASGFIDKSTPYIVKRADLFNSLYGEFSPMYFGKKDEELYFSSSRGAVLKDSVSGITGRKDNNFFVAKKNSQGDWQKPEELKGALNTLFDEGTPSFTADGLTMYYTYCARNSQKPMTAEIYMASRSEGQWGKGKKVSIQMDSSMLLAHPAISPDGEFLYFVSETPTGHGGKDIYRAKRINEANFGKIENVGSEINTPGDEMFPYVRDSVTLYFSSNGHPGMGGLDLFKATKNIGGGWIIENMGAPINSMGDDFGITFGRERDGGYFSSNRGDAKGYDHLYSFERSVYEIFIEGIVSDNDDYSLPDATVRIVGSDGFNAKAFTRQDGAYRFEVKNGISYVMMAGSEGFLNQSFEFKTDTEEKSETYYLDFFLYPTDKPIVLEHVYYDFDKAVLRAESKQALDELVKILLDNPQASIELSAHTDRKGSEKYNANLSQQRAQAVVSYLIKSGIASERLKAKGYGKEKPKRVTAKIAKLYDYLEEGDVLDEAYIESLSPEEQEVADQLNRRTEFQVIDLNFSL